MKSLIVYSTFIFILAQSCNDPGKRSSYILDEPDLVPEGIAYSETNNKFYLTSIAKLKIITVNEETGEQEDFISPGAYHFPAGAGIYADDERKQLHAVGGYYTHPDSISSLFTFDLNTKELLNKYDVTDEGAHFLNDMTLDKAGNIYMTDSKSSAVYTLEKGGKALFLFFRSEEIPNPNGITISDDDSKLYIATSKGVRIMDKNTKSILNEADTTSISRGIDGLEFYKKNLYAVQNGVESNGPNFRKLLLNKNQDKIRGFKLIDSNNPEMDLPLTFCIVHNNAVVIGNSNLQFLDQGNFTFHEKDSLKKTRLLIYDLRNN
jgi:DNA-binding beta-propeller fold protein YncE